MDFDCKIDQSLSYPTYSFSQCKSSKYQQKSPHMFMKIHKLPVISLKRAKMLGEPLGSLCWVGLCLKSWIWSDYGPGMEFGGRLLGINLGLLNKTGIWLGDKYYNFELLAHFRTFTRERFLTRTFLQYTGHQLLLDIASRGFGVLGFWGFGVLGF